MEMDVTDRRALREGLIASYSLEELRILCFDLDIDYEDLPGEAKSAKVVSLIEYLRRRSRLPDLLRYSAQDRPAFPWPVPAEPLPSTSPADLVEAGDVQRGWQTEFGIRSLRASVVWISTKRDGILRWQQCGFLVSPRGFILSMAFDVDDGDYTYAAHWNQMDFPARLVDCDMKTRVALFKIETEGAQLYNPQLTAADNTPPAAADVRFPAVPLAAEEPRVNDKVYLLGYTPGAGWINVEGTIAQVDGRDDAVAAPITIVDIASRKGFSGAPYMNWRGHVVGIHLGRRSLAGNQKNMIPARYALRLIAKHL